MVLSLVGVAGTATRQRRRAPEAPPAIPPAAEKPAAGEPVPILGEDVAEDRPVTTVELPPAPSVPEAAPPAPSVPEAAAAAPSAVEVEVPAPTAGRLVRLRGRLARSQGVLGRGVLTLLTRDTLDAASWEELEDTLIGADLGVAASRDLVAALRASVRVQGVHGLEEVRRQLREQLLTVMGPHLDRSLHTLPHDDRPAVLLVVGVNGTGKTTTCGKLARVLVADGRSVLLGAADTFRAAAADQLETWGSRVGARTVRGPEGADPASVTFEAVQAGTRDRVDAVIVDTAGRLHTKVDLMAELAKVKRVAERAGPVDEVLLVLDATTGQNGIVQARQFADAVGLTGIVLTKLDGTARGGIVVAVQRELGVPVKLVGLGEGPDDLAPFEPAPYVDTLLAEPAG